MDRISENISRILAEYNIIQKKDAAICTYGIVLFLTSVLEIGAILIISLFLGNFTETVVFLLGFLPIRIYAGGYHADTKLRCFLILVCVYIMFTLLMMIDIVEIYKYAMIAVPVAVIMCVYLWAPLKHKNKSLNYKEKKKFRAISLTVSVIEGMAVILLRLFNIQNKFSIALFLGLLTVLLSIIAAKIKEFFIEMREKI